MTPRSTPVAAARWSAPADVKAKVRRRWDDGTLLSSYAAGAEFADLDLPLRGPRASDIGAEVDTVRAWIASLEAGAHDGRRYHLEYVAIGGRHFGRNQLPSRARITSYEQAWSLLGTRGEVAAYDQILALTASVGAVHDWVAANPLQALAAADDWERLLAAYRWLDGARGSRRYLREIEAPGVDTKFVERTRPLLARLLDVPHQASAFVPALGLQTKPQMVRLRFDAGFLGMPRRLSEGTFRLAELATVAVSVQSAVIVENETTYLTLPLPDEGVLIWGKGFEVDRAGSLPWLAGADIHYWGDLDTHGFAILHRLRAWLPQTRSFLMDRETLLAHRDRWVGEASPTHAWLDRLDPEEAELYADLVSDRYAPTVRLEQERIDWDWCLGRLPYLE